VQYGFLIQIENNKGVKYLALYSRVRNCACRDLLFFPFKRRRKLRLFYFQQRRGFSCCL